MKIGVVRDPLCFLPSMALYRNCSCRHFHYSSPRLYVVNGEPWLRLYLKSSTTLPHSYFLDLAFLLVSCPELLGTKQRQRASESRTNLERWVEKLKQLWGPWGNVHIAWTSIRTDSPDTTRKIHICFQGGPGHGHASSDNSSQMPCNFGSSMLSIR
ncbi:hypothetical protein BDV36DRAFT_66973 [Aspergillus pseudocaelatus]|uniref:Uncharacterized protein n=1 Tax=Aspergillus pseudocaelatus TaxID=1825620 RepID=A0ABQ6WVZ3_9EURO|nr:hypothetical protein BDV36DRAFT_66973 [Aspergillus pseudocaelatus]